MIDLLAEDRLLQEVAYAFHYEGWYKDSIEGKFGLQKDENGNVIVPDHGRFRPSKNPEMDKEFFESIEFGEDGFSTVTDDFGNPLYKKEGDKYFVDSAIKGWDFLPPSWKEDNIKAAQTVLKNLQHCLPLLKLL